jgi:hypothetical protein
LLVRGGLYHMHFDIVTPREEGELAIYCRLLFHVYKSEIRLFERISTPNTFSCQFSLETERNK